MPRKKIYRDPLKLRIYPTVSEVKMAPPAVALAVLMSVFLYMSVSYISHYNLFEPHHARGRVVLVTDATTKLGNKVALEFAKFNTKLVLVGEDEVEVEKLRISCFKAGAEEVVGISGDFFSEKFRRNVMEKVEQHYGQLNYLVMLSDGNIDSNTTSWTDERSLKLSLDNYFMSYVHMAGLAIPSLKKNRGYIGIVSTMPGKISLPYLASVSASKAALQSYFMSLRQELKYDSDGYVSVTSVTIAYMDGVDGEREQGRWGTFFGKYGTVNMDDAIAHAVYAIGGRKKDVTFPFAAQCHSVVHRWFQSFYEDPEITSWNRLMSTFSEINLSM
ncbi:hypothetical protein CHUAL_006807 [Chamberlinius hualienensis]